MDFHIHSSHSYDCNVPVKQIIAEAKKKRLDIIGITDHGTRQGGLEAERIARGIQVLVGQETKTKQGDVIIFGLEEDLEGEQDVAKTCKKARSLGGFIIIPHPFDPMRRGIGKSIEKIVKFIDAVEVFNSKCFFDWSNRKAEAFAEQHELPGLAGSDAHKLEEVGMAHTLVEGDPFEAIRNNQLKIVKERLGKSKLLKRRVRKAMKRA